MVFVGLKHWAVLVLVAGATACQIPVAPQPLAGPRMPREVREGRLDVAVQTVERDVANAEVMAVLNAMTSREPICMRMPGLWLDSALRRGVFVVRYGLMARDWGAQTTELAQQRMAEFVEMGFLTVSLDGDRATYTIAERGRALMQGSFESGEPPAFCGPGGRRVVEITNMEWGAFDCGSLRVRFTHVADDWPAWATSPAARDRVAEAMLPPGVVGAGVVSLSRHWFARSNRAAAEANGALRSVCFDEVRQSGINGDLDLHQPVSPE
jgi:hypothetical protein